MSQEYCSKHHRCWDTDDEAHCPDFTFSDPCGTLYDPCPRDQITYRPGQKFGTVDGLDD